MGFEHAHRGMIALETYKYHYRVLLAIDKRVVAVVVRNILLKRKRRAAKRLE